MRALILLALVLPLLSGCANKHFYNANYPSNQQQQHYNQDQARCANYAEGLAPMPQGNYIDNSPKVTRGTFDVTSGGKTYTGSYNSYTYSTDYTASFVNGMNMGNALATPFRQQRISDNCMASLGWYLIKHKYDVPPPEGNENVKTMVKSLSANGFSNLRYNAGSYTMIRSLKKEGDTIRMIIANIWPDGKQLPDYTFMYGIGSWVIHNKKTGRIEDYSTYDLNNNRLAHETAGGSELDIAEGSPVQVYMLDYDLM